MVLLRQRRAQVSLAVVVISRRPGMLFFCALVFLVATASSTATEVTLLDSTREDSLDWTKYPFGPSAPTPGWVEESYTDFEKGINWRSYVVCDLPFKEVDNWLWTPFIERGPAKRVYVEMKFSVRDCSLYPGTTRTCKETFSLLYYEFDAATREPPPWQPDSYVLVDRIAADEGRFSQNSEVIINTEVRSISVTKKGLYFAFRDQGGCISLLAVRVYYKTCPEIVEALVRYPATPTGDELTSVERTTGQCVAGAEPEQADTPPAYMCTADGTWIYQQGRCHCSPGHEPDKARKSCKKTSDSRRKVCPPGRFQPDAAEGATCRPCPPHSSAHNSGMSRCRCDSGYFRAASDPGESPCTRPPSAPLNLTVNFVDQSTVILSWNPPADSGGRRDVTYRLACDACGSAVTYRPPDFSRGPVNETRVTISALQPVSTYRFQVFSVNGVSHLAPEARQQYVDITVTTEAEVPSMVSNVRVVEVKANQVVVAWDPPGPGDPFGQAVEAYEVRYFVRGKDHLHQQQQQQVEYASQTTKRLRLTVLKLQQQTEYGFQVRAKTTHGWGEFSPAVFKSTGQILAYVGEDQTGPGLHVIVVSVCGCVLAVALAVLAACLVRARRTTGDACGKGKGKNKSPTDCETLEYRNGEGMVVTYHKLPLLNGTYGKLSTPLFTQVGPSRTYVDPHTYEDPHQAVKEFAREIDASCITIEAIIGGGEFGDVCRGKLKYPGRPELCVAIKTLKSGSSDKAKKDFLTEASIMGQFEHPNVIFLQGVVTKSNPSMIITEFMENGSLDTFLRANDGKFLVIQLVGMLRGIASGMQYLSEMNYVHRDLAARNVLVNAQLVCKIADFGLSREIESTTEGAYTTRGGKIPVRWTAPEAIAFRKFTWASDVWSYGIVMWEVMSFGERPYWNWSNQDVIKAIERGYRLPPPMDCPEAIHQLMLDAWQKERTNRPSFGSVVQTLDRLLLCPESLRKLSQTRPHQNPLAPDVPDMTKFTSVDEWLASIKMGRYLENFQRAGVSSMEAVMRLSLQDLQLIGVTLVGHQKKILNSVQTMRAQVSINMSDGFLV